jgi:hypothetical protein
MLLRSVIARLAAEALSDYRNIRAGLGVQYGDFISYPSSISIPGSMKTIIEVPSEGSPYIRAELYDGKDEGVARSIYERMVVDLKAAFPEGSGDEKSADHQSGFSRRFAQLQYSARVSLRAGTHTDDFSVGLSLERLD